ncbi:glycosyltransferase family 4 protein [Bacillus sp. DNRA2]|uniref:glycosyltransferase family 4 protein n=1 Tax=Bacillus sp. DNRA2 TaxID=2723053 RepID=UPI00145CD286|nr:glycosyltransferase family 4 protein [Bacillus sp. DNRA2]NMD70173.1 glycosyltransferase family 4 protein [Bacillus sp. DNRA2]
MPRNEEYLRVLLISPLPPPAGGIATWTKLYLNSGIVKKNFINIINTSIKGKRLYNIDKRSIIEEFVRAFKIYYKTRKALKEQYDIIHMNCSCSKFGMIRDYFCIKAAKNDNSKIVVHFHCDTNYMIKDVFNLFLFKKICNTADKIFCLNISSYNHVNSISPDKSIIIPNFIEIEKSYINNDKIIANKIKNIVFVGHVIRSKGCVDINLIAERMPDLNFCLIGKVSDEIKHLPKPINLCYLGEISKDQVIEHMLSGDIFLFPTYTEGFPNVVLEAMACGLPVISTPVGAIPEMIEDFGGKIIDVGNIDGFINAIESLQDKKIREKMSIWNREKVKTHYSLNLVMEKIFKEYSDIRRL